MSNPPSPTRLSFDENIDILLEELVLAEKWQRPSILLAVHKSKFGQGKAEKVLEDRLTKLGQSVTHLVVDKERSDVPHLVLATPSPDRSVFFVSNLDWGGGEDRKDAFRALNMYRELFVDNHIRAVFWLTVNEAAILPRFAPDFWAFRHRVIEFTGQRIPRKASLPAGVLVWDIENPIDPFDTLEARIAVREELLAKLPHNAEANSSRIDLLYNLGHLYWSLGNSEKASQQLLSGLEMASPGHADPVRSSLLNGLAIIAYEAGNPARAADLYAQALQNIAQDPLLSINLSATLSTLGRNQEALMVAKKAVKLGERDARVWEVLGYVYCAMGKSDEAITCFNKAAALAPRVAALHAALAICYDIVERPDETRRELEAARSLARDKALVFQDLYEAVLLEDPVKALDLARAAIRNHRVSAFELMRDPNLNLLIDPVLLSGLTA